MAANGNFSVFVVHSFLLHRSRLPALPSPLAGRIYGACWQRADARAGPAQQGDSGRNGRSTPTAPHMGALGVADTTAIPSPRPRNPARRRRRTAA